MVIFIPKTCNLRIACSLTFTFIYPQKTNMTMENHVSAIENGDFPMSC